MDMINTWRACVCAIGLAFALPADAIVILTGEYAIGGNNGATGVVAGDTVHVTAFYDPLYAQFEFQDDRSVVYSFAAGHAGLSFTVGDSVWRTTGPLSINTYYAADTQGRPKSAGIEFLGYTRMDSPGVVPTTLDTPWSADVIGQAWMLYFLEFTAAVGFDPAEVLTPRLYTETDFGSVLAPAGQDIFGAAYADTSSGGRFFNFFDPNYTPPVATVPEPGALILFGFGVVGLIVSSRRPSSRSALTSIT